MITSEEIKRRLWNGANELRGSMDASRYKDYMLGLMFYKFLSDKTLDAFKRISDLNDIDNGKLLDRYKSDAEAFGDDLFEMIQNMIGYYVEPEYLYQTWLKDINEGDFEVQKVTDSLNNFERTIASASENNDFKGLFSSSTLDLTDTALGNNLNTRSKNIKDLILLFSDLNMVSLQEGDILGDAYEYLIGQFAMESGKKAGEFYTPRQVSEVMAQIVAKNSAIKSIYDPTVGSGSLLLTVGKHLSYENQKLLDYYGQEKNTATYNLTRMNLLLHGVRPEKMTIKNGDTLAEDWPEDPEQPNEGVLFDAVVMNPPYSLSNWNKSDIKVSDPRFEIAGVLPPTSKGDFAFLLHGLFHLSTSGTMAIVLPHGVLFRGASEGQIRKRLLEKNYIDTIIGLPSNLFTNTGIPVVVIILKKNRPLDEPVLIIDASKSFIKVGKQNELQEKDIAKIVDTYSNRTEEEGYSYLANREEIIENEYNMNIPRYVMSTEEEIPHDVDGHLFGGIPIKDIKNLKIIHSLVPDTIKSATKQIREGYVELIKPIDDLEKEILSSKKIVEMSKEIETKTCDYINGYWKILKEVDQETNINELSNAMLKDGKNILTELKYVDTYEGYQLVAEIWKDFLKQDIEKISASEFYTLGRTREPNIVTKGSGNNKREVQEGWIGAIVPNELIKKRLFQDETDFIENKKTELQEVESELSDLVESAKDEDSDEGVVLYDALKKNSEGEPGDSFESKVIKSEKSKIEKNTMEYELLNKVENCMSEKSKLNREIKNLESNLNEDIQEKILKLSDEEIDELVFEKWFGETVDKMIELSQAPIIKELDTLKLLNERYSQTMNDIDEEIATLEKELEAMMKDIVVVS